MPPPKATWQSCPKYNMVSAQFTSDLDSVSASAPGWASVANKGIFLAYRGRRRPRTAAGRLYMLPDWYHVSSGRGPLWRDYRAGVAAEWGRVRRSCAEADAMGRCPAGEIAPVSRRLDAPRRWRARPRGPSNYIFVIAPAWRSPSVRLDERREGKARARRDRRSMGRVSNGRARHLFFADLCAAEDRFACGPPIVSSVNVAGRLTGL